MHNALAWFITFNFVNIAWVFFRAKEWSDAIKILSGMLGLSGVVLPNPLIEKLAFLKAYGFQFGGWIANIDSDGGKTLVPSLLITLLIILLFQNSNQWANAFKPNKKMAFMVALMLSFGVLSLTKVSEFLYFNF